MSTNRQQHVSHCKTPSKSASARPAVAFLLSFLVPGLGLLYLGKRVAAGVNFSLAMIVPALLIWLWPTGAMDVIHYALLAIAAGSAGAAHAAATRAVPRRMT